MMVTFVALILSLVTASVKNAYNNAAHDRQHDALVITELDLCLRDLGPMADVARADLRSYMAGVIASTWPDEPAPTGVSYPKLSPGLGGNPILGNIMRNVRLELARINPSNPAQARVVDDCRQNLRDFLAARYAVIEDVHEGLSAPFYRMMVLWLMVLFGGFGLIAPRYSFAVVTIALLAFSLSTTVFGLTTSAAPMADCSRSPVTQ